MEPVRTYAGRIPNSDYPKNALQVESILTIPDGVDDSHRLISRLFNSLASLSRSERNLFECSIYPLGAVFSGSFDIKDKDGVEDLILMISALLMRNPDIKRVEAAIKIVET